MRMGQGVRFGLGHGGITCVLQTQFSSFLMGPAGASEAKLLIAVIVPSISGWVKVQQTMQRFSITIIFLA